MKKVLLYSGGMDSWLIDKIWKPDVKLFVDVGTKSSKEERKRLPEDVIVKELDLSEFEDSEKNYLLPLRNLFLIELASYYGDEICLGAIGGSIHYDNNMKFGGMVQDILNYLYSEIDNKKVKVVMPFVDTSKADLIKLYVEQGGDIEEAYTKSFSCYSPIDNKECGQCLSCKLKIQAFKENGYIAPQEERND